jgi:Zn-finger nucleic acid-binding protein
MPAETLNCPMCGAAASSDSPHCEHCGARLATVACPSCFGLMFIGAQFCSHCGAKASRTTVADAAIEICPRCRSQMEAVVIGATHLEECPKCEGIWASADAIRQICQDQEQQAAVLGMPFAPPTGTMRPEKEIHYLPCPICHNLMNRVNFDHCSGVIVNVCSQHGTWFDKDALRHVVEFIRAGGLEKERRREREELEEVENRTRSQQATNAWYSQDLPMQWSREGTHLGVSLLASLADGFLRKW